MAQPVALRPALRAYIAAIITLAVFGFLTVSSLDGHFPGDLRQNASGLFAFLVVGLLLELAEHRLAVSASGSISFIVYLAGSLVFGPTWGGVLTAISFGAAHTLNRRPPLKIAFNASQQTFAILIAGQVYLGLGGVVRPGSLDASLLPFTAMVLTFFTVNSFAVSFAVALSEQRGVGEVWLRNTWSLAAYDLVASTLGLGIAVLYSSRYGLFAVAGVVALILFLRHVYMVSLQLQAANREMLDVMVKSIEARDPYTSGHSQRVAELARLLAREVGLGLREIDSIHTAALLHDVGKIYEEFAPLLRKEVRLTADEFSVMKTHPIRSAELVGTVSTLRGIVDRAVRHHHENYDGSGYPDGLCADAIPVGARIIMVADTVDAMTSHRPYRAALTYEEVVSELRKYAGLQFDPSVVEAFLSSATIRAYVEARRREQGTRPELRSGQSRVPSVEGGSAGEPARSA
jgi:putative nucleotidyltransferase with HDIG domain